MSLQDFLACPSEATDFEIDFVEDLLNTIADPDPPNILKFKNIIKGFKVPYVCYCDFESFISNDSEQVHTPSGYSILVVSIYEEAKHAHTLIADRT